MSNSVVINLNEGSTSTISSAFANGAWTTLADGSLSYQPIENVRVAYGAVIENAFGGAGNDTLFGNEVCNYLAGASGNDHLLGFGGNDALNGGPGDDILDGGDGFDFALYGDASPVHIDLTRAWRSPPRPAAIP